MLDNRGAIPNRLRPKYFKMAHFPPICQMKGRVLFYATFHLRHNGIGSTSRYPCSRTCGSQTDTTAAATTGAGRHCQSLSVRTGYTDESARRDSNRDCRRSWNTRVHSKHGLGNFGHDGRCTRGCFGFGCSGSDTNDSRRDKPGLSAGTGIPWRIPYLT